MTSSRRDRRALRASYAGLGLTLVAAVLPYVDRGTTRVLADHIRTGYPGYTGAQVDAAVSTWLVVLTAVGALGTLGWLWTAWTIRRRKGWAPWSATAILAVAAAIALAALTVTDTSGDVGLAPMLGWAVAAPCVAGVGAVALLWRDRGSLTRDE